MYMPQKISRPSAPAAVLTACLSLLVFLLAGCAGQNGTEQAADSLAVDTMSVGGDTSAADASDESIYDLLRGDNRFSTFAAAIDSAQLDQTLMGPGPFTVFAPTNEALAQMNGTLEDLLQDENEDELRDLLLSHISNGEKMSTTLAGQSIRTLAGGDVSVSGSGDSLRIGEARVVEADIDAANGVIHAVAQVLSPSMQDEGL